MTIPIHVQTTVEVDRPAYRVLEVLVRDPQQLATAATAAARPAVVAVAQAAGLDIGADPTVTAGPAGPDDLGAIEVRWDGDEDTTGWPAMTAWLVVNPTAAGTTRLTLVSHRAPAIELTTIRIDRVARDRITRVATRRFLRAVADRLEWSELVATDPQPAPRDRVALGSAA